MTNDKVDNTFLCDLTKNEAHGSDPSLDDKKAGHMGAVHRMQNGDIEVMLLAQGGYDYTLLNLTKTIELLNSLGILK